MRWILLAASTALATTVACAPIETTTRWRSTPGPAVEIERSRDEALVGTVVAKADGLEVSLSSRATCVSERVTEVARERIDRREIDGLAVGLEYVSAVGLGAAGGALLVDVSDLGLPDGAQQPTGIGLASLGGLIFVAAIVDSFRGGEERHPAPAVTRVVPRSRREVACGEAPARGVAVTLELETDKPGAKRSIPLGSSDKGGLVRLPWASVPREVLAGPSWTRVGAIVAVERGAGPKVLAQVELAPARALVAEAAWTAASRAGTPEALADFARDFPEARTDARASVLLGAVEKRLLDALAARDAMAARQHLESLRRAGGAPVSPELAQKVQRLEDELALEGEWRALEQARAALAGKLAAQAVDVAATVALGELHAVLRAKDPSNPRHGEVALTIEDFRTVQTKRLLAMAKARRAAKAHAEARALLAELARLGPLDDVATRERASLDRDETKARLEQARTASKAGRFDEALEHVAAAERITPGDRGAAAERAKIASRQAADEAARARAAAREQRAEERAAKEEQRRGDQAAKEEQRRADQAAKEEQRRADQAARDAAKLEAERAASARLEAERSATHAMSIVLPERLLDGDVLATLALPLGCVGTFSLGEKRGDTRVLEASLVCGATRFELRRQDAKLELACTGQTCAECARLARDLTAEIPGRPKVNDACAR